jgi:stress-induced-phosphoprotein 1
LIDDAVLRSNRSACHARLRQFGHALADADAAVRLRPDWPKGHGRRGAALHGLGDLGAAEAAYREGIALDGESAPLRQGLDDVLGARDAKSGASG